MTTLGLRLAAGSARATRLSHAWTRGRQLRARHNHQRTTLPYPINEGLGEFLPPTSLRMIAEDYQQGLLDRLNDSVKGTVLENKSVVQTVIEAAQDPSQILAFNYASEALNNSYFLQSMKPPPADASSHEGELVNSAVHHRIRTDYSSLDQLKSEFSAGVLGMFSSGWMWLVCDNTGALSIYPTFGTGTLLIRSRKSQVYQQHELIVGELESNARRSAPDDASPAPSSIPSPPLPPSPEPTPSSPVSGISHAGPPLHPPTQTRSYAMSNIYSKRAGSLYDGTSGFSDVDSSTLGERLFPLFCVSVHEHAWVSAGYGVWGKEEYMKRFWSVLDWKAVRDRYEKWQMDGRYML
ncbi:manganese and iron superoxide dismutase [Laetiporus sulphureus 93-53]|uniref:Manganese and iron superoxide dismutase n=1 Tax=Laetiporus sulphureus 93-53 TaxID=1314785 RepID=A0A165I5G4_9APHY|nr:manganese and iron superoxide dismutase [Laetiporus sulphureus 93-53]KZT12615.1 manganese and iron superoxide dismutase [Laetiporus sulphureus 93-53]